LKDKRGRVLFSTHHTEGTGGAALLPQEKVLLGVLLEVASARPVAPRSTRLTPRASGADHSW
jgi:hypothetical protein